MKEAPNLYVMKLEHRCHEGAGDARECGRVLSEIMMLPFVGSYAKILDAVNSGSSLPDGRERYLFQ